jgi:hypothetical protein
MCGNEFTLSNCELEFSASNLAFEQGKLRFKSYLAHVPFDHSPHIYHPVEFIGVFFLGFEVFWVFCRIVFFHNFEPIARLCNASWSVFFVPSAKHGSIRNSDFTAVMC